MTDVHIKVDTTRTSEYQKTNAPMSQSTAKAKADVARAMYRFIQSARC